MKREEQHDWLQTAELLARYPSGPHARTALWVFSGIAVFCFLIGLAALAGWRAAETQALSSRDLGGSASTFLYLAMGVSGLGLVMALFALHQRRVMARFRRSRTLLRDAVQRAGAQWLVDGRQVADWLTRYWRGSYPYRSLRTSADILQAAASFEGFPVLLEITPAGFHETRGEHGANLWWARVAVAADLPTDADIDAHRTLIEPLLARGYEPAREPGGLVARARPSVRRTVEDDPKRVLDLLHVGSELAHLAKLCGGTAPVRRV